MSWNYKKVPQASANLGTEPMSNSTRPAGGKGSMEGSTKRVVGSPGNDYALTNRAYCSANDIRQFRASLATGSKMIKIRNLNTSKDQVSIVLTVESNDGIADGTLALNAFHRRNIKVSANDDVFVESFEPEKGSDLALLTLDIQFVKYRESREINAPALAEKVARAFAGQVMTVGQMASFEFVGTNYYFTVKILEFLPGAESPKDSNCGVLISKTGIIFESTGNSGIKIIDQKGRSNTNLFKAKDFNFQKLGIGGLDAEFQDIFRRAFSSRVFPTDVINKLGIQHVKGMLLWGPPGTGKTLIARQIGKMLNGREPKIVNGPEVLSKFVGETEKNVRDLFADAEKEQREHGDQSELHIIIFDEIDAICKSRGSTRDGTGVHDSIVNQLLTKIDGVESLNNILLIGMTNRKDMLDEALLRPGRLEVQIEIGLPDEHGRVQILQIHTSKMRESSFLDNVRLEDLAAQTKNFSGAELEGLVKSAVSFALNRQIDYEDLSKPLDEDNIKVTMRDFLAALNEVKPAFGAAVASLERCRVNGILDCVEENSHILQTVKSLVEQLRVSDRTPLLSCLLEGPIGSGKTALAATVGIDSAENVPFVKIISAETMVGLSESTKCGMINKVFEDAYKSPLSIIILDDIERLLEYVDIGPRFSNLILQTLLVLVKRLPPEKRKLLVIGTTTMKGVMRNMDVLSAFSVTLHVPVLKPDDMRKVLSKLNVFTPDDLETAIEVLPEEGMPIKKLLELVEMAKHVGRDDGGQDTDNEKIGIDRFLDCYHGRLKSNVIPTRDELLLT